MSQLPSKQLDRQRACILFLDQLPDDANQRRSAIAENQPRV